jgi:hypothetical protein
MPTPYELASQLERRIQCRTHGRVRRVSVELGEEQVVLHGDAATYYLKQLAQQAVSEILNGREIVNAIDVH